MCQGPRWLDALPVMIAISFIAPLSQADEANNATQSTVEVINSTLTDMKIKRLGEPVQVQYTFQAQKHTEPVDVYIAYTASNAMNELWFIQPPGEFTSIPVPYYSKISHDKEEIVLDFTLPADLTLVGEHFFYAALMTSGTNVSTLAPSEWPWEKLSIDTIFVSR